MICCYYGGDTDDLSDAAKQILHVIMSCYPGHNVKVWGHTSGCFFINHLDFEQCGGHWGMNLKAQRYYSASHMQHDIVMQFGEWLERANLRRGEANGDPIKLVDGVPLKNHAVKPEPTDKDIQKYIETAIREAPRPQVERMMGNADG